MEKKVTSYRLSVSVLQQLDLLLEEVNKEQQIAAIRKGTQFKKVTRGDLIETLIVQAFDYMKSSKEDYNG